MGRMKILLVFLLSGIAVSALLLLGESGAVPNRALASGRGPMEWREVSPTSSYTLYLPVAMRQYDPSYVSPFGIVMYGNVNDAAGLQTMKNAGSEWVTTYFVWSEVEPSPGNYDWSSFDAKAQNAQAAGMDIFVLFSHNPSWAAALPGGPVTNTQDLIDFTTLMAERYDCDGVNDAPGHPCVHYWSLYAEPDNGDIGRAYRGQGYWGHNGAGLAALLSQVSPAIHAANPRAKVLIGGLAYDWFEEEGGPFVRSFLTDTLTALNTYPGGARAYIDAVAFHFYPISASRWPTIREKALEIRGIMARHGVGDLPLLCPEAGYWSSPKFSSSEQIQARRLVQMYVRSMSVGVRFLSWYGVFDTAIAGSAEDTYPDRTSGLLRVDGTFKPSYYAYRTLTQELAWARYLRSLQAANAEGYVFRMSTGREKTVLWATASSATVVFPYPCLRLVDTIGNVYSPVVDGDPNWDWDHSANGQVLLGVYQDMPFYVEPCQ